jgi:hypothetical protein
MASRTSSVLTDRAVARGRMYLMLGLARPVSQPDTWASKAPTATARSCWVRRAACRRSFSVRSMSPEITTGHLLLDGYPGSNTRFLSGSRSRIHDRRARSATSGLTRAEAKAAAPPTDPAHPVHANKETVVEDGVNGALWSHRPEARSASLPYALASSMEVEPELGSPKGR